MFSVQLNQLSSITSLYIPTGLGHYPSFSMLVMEKKKGRDGVWHILYITWPAGRSTASLSAHMWKRTKKKHWRFLKRKNQNLIRIVTEKNDIKWYQKHCLALVPLCTQGWSLERRKSRRLLLTEYHRDRALRKGRNEEVGVFRELEKQLAVFTAKPSAGATWILTEPGQSTGTYNLMLLCKISSAQLFYWKTISKDWNKESAFKGESTSDSAQEMGLYYVDICFPCWRHSTDFKNGKEDHKGTRGVPQS